MKVNLRSAYLITVEFADNVSGKNEICREVVVFNENDADDKVAELIDYYDNCDGHTDRWHKGSTVYIKGLCGTYQITTKPCSVMIDEES